MDLEGTDGQHPSGGASPAPASPAALPAAARLPLRHKIGYGSGQLVELTVGSMLNIFALYYTTAVCGLPGALAGLALGAGLVIDAILDPLIGSVSDNWRSRFGRRIPFMIFGLVPLLLSFNLLFALPSTLNTTALFLTVMFLSVTLRVSLSTFGLPYQALGVDLSDDYAERSSIAAWRWGLGIFGTFAVIGLGYGVFLNGPGGLSQRDAYLPLTLTLSLLVLGGGAVAIRTGLITRHRSPVTAPASDAIYRRLFGEIREIFRNPTFRILFTSVLVMQVSQGVNQALAMHVSLFFWGFEAGQLQSLSLAAVFGLALGAPLAGPLLARAEKRTVMLLSSAGMVVGHSLPIGLRLLGLLPPDMEGIVGLLSLAVLLGSASFGISVVAFGAMIPDAVDEHELYFGTRREGMFVAGWSFAGKAATGVGLLVGGVVLQLVGFPSQVSPDDLANVAVPQQTLIWLAIAGGPGAGAITLIGIAMMIGYRIDRRQHARIVAKLASRRSNY